MSILKELNELAAKYSQDYEKEATIEGAIDAVDKSLEGALGALSGDIEDLQDLAYGEGGTPAEPAEGSILDNIGDLQDATEDLQNALYGVGGTPAEPAEWSIADRIGDLEASGVLVVTVEHDGETGDARLTKTWQEIHDAPFAIIVEEYEEETPGVSTEHGRSIDPVIGIQAVEALDPSSSVYIVNATGSWEASSPNDRPIYAEGN